MSALTRSLTFQLFFKRVRWLTFLAVTALGVLVFQIPAQVLGTYVWVLVVAWLLLKWGSDRLLQENLRAGEPPPAVDLGFDSEGEVPLRAVPESQGILATLFRVALAPRLRLGKDGIILTDRRGERVIEWARIGLVDWSIEGLELTLTSGERMSLRTFSQPSSFLLSDPGVTTLVRAAAFQAMTLNQRLAERVKEAMRGNGGAAYRTAAKGSAEPFRGEPGQGRDGVLRVDAHFGGKHARIDDVEIADLVRLEARADHAGVEEARVVRSVVGPPDRTRRATGSPG